ncbi:cobaltochelatase CobT-related protein [Agathobacter sp.]
MEENDIKEEKRAKNFIWMAADDYTIEPLFLAFMPDGKADMYLNMVIGLTYKWYDQGKIDAFFNQLTGKDHELYEGLLWIGLENALYEKEKENRSALGDLRLEYAQEGIDRFRRHKEYSRTDQMRNAHCREILGQESGLDAENEKILHAFSYTGDMTTDQIIDRTRENLLRYFSYHPSKTANKEGIYFLQKVAGAFHAVGKVSSDYVRAKSFDDANTSSEGRIVSMEHTKHYLMQFSMQRDPLLARRYVQGCFGESIYKERQQEAIEKVLCTENHRNCHLLFTRGSNPETRKKLLNEIENRREKKEILEFTDEADMQYERNKAYFEKNRAVYQNSIRRLTEKLRICLETESETFASEAICGKVNPSKIWKAIYLDNPRVFEHKEEVEAPGFSVDILMDASSSRKQMQEKIAAQAYVLSKSLEDCGIPVQIYSYCSIRGYTVMRIFKGYEESGREDELFRYVAAGNNRDGLALRAAGHLMENSPKQQKILLMLSDASPMDDQIAGEGAFYKDKEYTDMLAVQDTINEVQRLGHSGVQVIGIFMGSAHESGIAGRIFGRKLVKIANISEFSDAVGRVLQDIISV